MPDAEKDFAYPSMAPTVFDVSDVMNEQRLPLAANAVFKFACARTRALFWQAAVIEADCKNKITAVAGDFRRQPIDQVMPVAAADADN
jgi:hypothetical protein